MSYFEFRREYAHQIEVEGKKQRAYGHACRQPDGKWKIISFQNTPAAFHGRPELAEQLSAELREELRRRT